MKAIVILYKGREVSKETIRNIVEAANFDINNLVVNTLSDSEYESLKDSTSTLTKLLTPPDKTTIAVSCDPIDQIDNAADVVIRVTRGIKHNSIAKRAIPLICKHRYEPDSTTRELVKAIDVLSTNGNVSSSWLKRHGLTRAEWNDARNFISGLSNVEVYG